jgi:hypothetical protein
MKFFTKLAFICVVALAPDVSAQQITARYYPEKQHYLVSEPIIVIFEIVNNSPKAVETTEFNCRHLHPNEFEVGNAPPKRTVDLYGCGGKIIFGSCFGSFREIRAHGKSRTRFLLEGAFELDSPGKYHIRANRAERVHGAKGNDLSVDLNVASEFDVDVRAPNPGELEVAYQPLFEELHSHNPMVQDLAASAVTQNPPSFAEAVILNFADDPSISISSAATQYAVNGLQRLATPATRAKLVEMASTTSDEHVRQPAINALGKIGNPQDCQAMLGIASGSKNYTQAEAYTVAGRICKERALPTLTSLVNVDDAQLLMGVAGGFGNTSSRNAVPPLITVLQSPDSNTRRYAADGLATLTHWKSKYGIEDEGSARQANTEWVNWWSINGSMAPIYGSDQCVAPQPLP